MAEKMNDDGSVEYDLKWPFEANGERIERIRLRRPIGLDLERMDKIKGETTKGLMFIAYLSNLSPDDVKKMDGADIIACQEIITGFLE